jgi:hypothetical protein
MEKCQANSEKEAKVIRRMAIAMQGEQYEENEELVAVLGEGDQRATENYSRVKLMKAR